MPTSLTNDLRRLRTLKARRDKAKEKYEADDKEFKDFQRRVFDRMNAEEVESQKVAGTLFVPIETTYAQVQDRQAFIDWAKENEDELIEPKERKELLNALVRQCLDDGEELPPGVTFYNREYISQRAA